MGIYESNRTDTQDNAISSIGESESTSTARIGTKFSGEKGLHTLSEITAAPTSSYPVLPVSVMYPTCRHLLNGSSFIMSVNGSGVNVNFSFAPSSGQIAYLCSLECFFLDNGTPDFDQFGDIAALTNGVDIVYRRNGVNYIMANLKTNVDIISFFHEITITNGNGFLNAADMFFGVKEFRYPLPLNGTNGDYIRAIVKDNLTGIDAFIIKTTYLTQV